MTSKRIRDNKKEIDKKRKEFYDKKLNQCNIKVVSIGKPKVNVVK